MAQPKKTNAMLPLIMIGAALFGLGIYQSTQPKEPETNTGFVAPSPNSPPLVDSPLDNAPPSAPSPSNPRTMQAPDGPPMAKDAAQMAAEAPDTTTASVVLEKSVLDEPWFAALKANEGTNFRLQVLDTLTTQQKNGTINCRPALPRIAVPARNALEEVSCTATDGSMIEARFDADNDGEVNATGPQNQSVRIQKNGDGFSVRFESE